MTEPTDPSVSFYDALAPMFDVMTDWEARLSTEGPFLRAVLEAADAHTVFDAACGSGGHALALARWGYVVAGADSSAVMLEMARGKARAAGLTIPFTQATLGELPSIMTRPHDAVLCLGNSLPHLLTQAELVTALQGMAGILAPRGLLVLHNLNYDRRWQVQPRWFAAQGGELDGQEVLVWRFADYLPATGRIDFHIALFRKTAGGWQVEVHTTPHRPLFQADLLAALAEAGFEEITCYGGMQWPPPPFDAAQSGDLVVVARRA